MFQGYRHLLQAKSTSIGTVIGCRERLIIPAHTLQHCTVGEYFDQINTPNTPIGQKTLISPTVQCHTKQGEDWSCQRDLLVSKGLPRALCNFVKSHCMVTQSRERTDQASALHTVSTLLCLWALERPGPSVCRGYTLPTDYCHNESVVPGAVHHCPLRRRGCQKLAPLLHNLPTNIHTFIQNLNSQPQ